jgi:hypothetical protein
MLTFTEPGAEGIVSKEDESQENTFYACKPTEAGAPPSSWALWVETKAFVWNNTCLAIAVYANLKAPVLAAEAWEYT